MQKLSYISSNAHPYCRRAKIMKELLKLTLINKYYLLQKMKPLEESV